MAEMPPIDVTPEEWEIVRETLALLVPDQEVWAFGWRVTGGGGSRTSTWRLLWTGQ